MLSLFQVSSLNFPFFFLQAPPHFILPLFTRTTTSNHIIFTHHHDIISLYLLQTPLHFILSLFTGATMNTTHQRHATLQHHYDIYTT
ncbi:hypothetical protein E2C01_077381 [Portunus trituberculatus]|uniref:Uncharacterized protein n=1 Tax=Portunus trituberculatus TaxID=210409 RepID=A0A5B7IEA3_PORTR|nr:hypothetical protein [Portunus trituberculatus]